MPEIKAYLHEPSGLPRSRWPLTWGVPLARGQWRADQPVALSDTSGRPFAACARALATWPDASVKWALFDAQVDLEPGQRLPLLLHCGPEAQALPFKTPLSCSVDEHSIHVDTGALKVQLARSGPRLVLGLEQEGRQLLPKGRASEFTATDATGRSYAAQIESLELEEQNDLRLVLRATGGFVAKRSDERLLSWQVRCYFYAHHGFFKLYHTFIHDQTSPLVELAQLRFALPLDLAGPRRAALGSRSAWFGHGIDVDPLQNPVSLLQWQLERHTVFATERSDERSDERSNGHGWVHLADAHSGITLKLRRPWQNYPKACSAQASEIAIDLYPDLRQFAPPEREGGANWTQLNRPQGPDFKGPLHIPQGMAKTHEIFVHCGAPLPDARQVDQLCLAFEQPLMPVLEGEHYASSNALGPFQPYRDAYWPLELELRRFCTTPNGTGIINSGDVVKLAQLDDQMHTQTCENLAYDLPRSLLRQFLRTGDAALFWEGEAAVMHLMDIDTVHYSAEHPEWVGGPYVEWSQNHHYADSDEAALSGPKTSHAWLGSLLDYYFLTGYERAREIAEACADFCRRNAPYRWKQELSADKRLRALDPDEDWPFSTRVAGWPLVAMSTYYEAFRDERFLRSMEALVDLFAVWQDEEGRWREQIGSFNRGATPFMNASVLQGLMRYHQCTGDGRALQMQLKGARFLAAQGRSLEGIFYYKESALSATPHASTAMLLEPLAFAYEQSGEHQLLDAGYRLFRWLIDSGSVSTYMLKDLFAFMPLLERLGLLENYRGICIDEEFIKGSRPRGA